MRKYNLLTWFRNIPISRKLYFTVGTMALLIVIELGTLTFAIHTLSAVRAYVGGESIWSRAQKDAAYYLQKYGRSHNEQDYLIYQNFLRVPLGDHKTRMELVKAHPDFAIAREGFLEGRIHPDDISGAINLFRRFHRVSYINDAIQIWTRGDSLMARFISLGDALHAEITTPNPSPEKINNLLARLGIMNDSLTDLEDKFSYTLGAGSRWLEHIIMRLLFGLVLTVEICGLSLAIFVSRSISRGLNGIINAADKIAKGNLAVRAEKYSNDEIGTLATAFNDMTQKLEQNINALKKSEENLSISNKIAEQSVVVKENFLANMSHEIRTPMNAVIGFTGLLENTPLTGQQSSIVRSMKIAGQSLLSLINDILDYSKLESGMIVIEQIPFSVRKIFESLEVLLRQKAAAKKLALKFNVDQDIPGTILGDPTRLMQILLNLTDNAIKFTEKGEVEITVAKLKNIANDDVMLEFQVKDTGKGIPKDKQDMIFERFTQISAEATRQYGGTGLGLSIVKSLIALQNGALSLESEPGTGSAFSFIITYKKTTESDAGEMPAVTSSKTDLLSETKAEPLYILVAEDNAANQMVIELILEKQGIVTDIAENGKIAVEKLKAKHYDLILMDIQMPIMDGYEATHIIRNELKSNIPIIALTAHSMNQEKEKCLASGMNDFISKPFDAKNLYETIVRLCAD